MHNKALVQKLVSSVSLFQAFTTEEASNFLIHCRMESHPAGKRLIQEGETGQALFVLLSGTVIVTRHSGTGEQELARLGQGETFGELALLDHHERSANVDTLGPVRVLVYERDSTLWTPAEAAKLYRNLALILVSRLRHADDKFAELSEKLIKNQSAPTLTTDCKPQAAAGPKVSGKRIKPT
ncbi:Crp/Fnr family transcriptional regulator [Chitinimonas sp. BJB300]|uniref:Crp/Fnr family transcriptional regulator n=1 Tax=Chitinimonas sp. BJB300 TaxID=1559339 RepID=UPI000C0DB7B2|nr:cyclic nucleotide-binding domain-containing protein [Chitinimonas sp. BJB300]PHV10690.1 hypothetical protein CSQ89_14885 [Chitinimonas sp. BJB300]TSJ90770.1 cyclic nucleotide-binding domain-containing protein [Chitinimonas sp. BJB300]